MAVRSVEEPRHAVWILGGVTLLQWAQVGQYRRAVAAHVQRVPPQRAARPRAYALDRLDVEEPQMGRASDGVEVQQVLEHVRHPLPLLAEAGRVIRPGGFIAGSTSQLEPFHSLSMWNYTPLGFVELAVDAGLAVVEIRPGIDSLSLIGRRLVGPRRCFDRWWGSQSPLNRVIDLYGRLRGLGPRAINATKLVFCGQFAFLARRPG